MATPATYTSRMADAPSPERGGSRRRPRRCLPGPAGRRRSSSRPACRSGAARDRARRRSGSSAPTRPQAGRRRRPRTALGPRAWTGARSTRPRASPCATAGSPRTAPRRYTGSTRAARPGRPPRTAGSAGRPGRARPRRADGGRERSGGGRAARWSRRRSRGSRSIARRPLSSASVVSARWLYCERRSGACGGRARSSLLRRSLGYASSVVAALARLGSRLDALATSHLADTTLVTGRGAEYAMAGMDDFQGRVAVITGGGGGIGAAMARAFAARGARIVLADVDRAAMEGVAAVLGKGGAEVLVVPTDVTALESVRALADAAERRFGAVHIVCNNAGVATMSELGAATHADWQYTMNVNFWGVVHGVETFVPRLLARGAGGHVVNTASMAGLVGMRWLGVYCSSKFAVVGLSEALHRELADRGIGVSVLCPMIVQTGINENSVRNRPPSLRNPGPDVVPAAEAMVGGVIAPDEVARRV